MKTRSIDKRLFTILMIVFVQMVGASMVLPVLPLYAHRRFGLAPQPITLLVSSFFIAQFIAGPYIGTLSDRHGRVPILIISQIGTAASYVMLGVAQGAGMLFASRILDGITGGNIIAAQAYVTDITPREKRTQALGYVFAAFGLGFIIGPALGGILSAAYGEKVPFVVAAVAATLVVLLTWRTLDEALTPEQREANRRFRSSGLAPAAIAHNASLLLVLGIAFVGQYALGLVQSTFALYGEAVLFAGYSERATSLGIGLLLACIGFAQFFTQIFILPRALRRTDEERLVIFGTASRAVGLLVWAVVTSPWIAAMGTMFFAGGMGVAMPPLQSLATGTVADELRGGVLGVYQSIISLSIIVGTASGGVLFAITPPTPYWTGMALTIVTLLPAFLLFRHSRRANLARKAAASNL